MQTHRVLEENMSHLYCIVRLFACNKVSHLGKSIHESEEYSISRYKNGLRWSIKKKLSAESFDFLTDLVLAATHVEEVIQREQKVLREPQKVLDTTTQSLTCCPIVSETPSDCPNSWRNIATPSVTNFTDNEGYSGNVSSNAGMVHFPEAIKENIDVSVENKKKETSKESNSLAGCTTKEQGMSAYLCWE